MLPAPHDIAMPPAEMRDFIRAQSVVILTSNGPGGHPHAIPMGFLLNEDDRIYCVSWRKTQKVANLARSAKASLLFEAGNAEDERRAVHIAADLEIIDEPDYTFEIMTRMNDAAGSREAPMPVERLREIAGKRVVLRFTPQKVISWDATRLPAAS